MGRRWWLSCSVSGVAAVALVTFVADTMVPRSVRTRPASGPSYVDAACEVPQDWSTFLVVDHFDPARATPSTAKEGAFNELAATTAPVGDVFVRFQSDLCTWGGSACAGTAPTMHHVRVGPLDESGVPLVASSFRCAGTPGFNAPEGGLMRSCSPSSLTLRRAGDARTFVLTIRDPDTLEIPIAAFARSPAGPRGLWPPLRRDLDWQLLVASAVLALALGAHRLHAARRFVRAGGILSWRDAVVSKGKLEAEGETALAVEGAATSFTSAVLIAPSLLGAASYRRVPSVALGALFVGSRAAAAEQARKALSAARVMFVITMLVSAVGFFAYH